MSWRKRFKSRIWICSDPSDASASIASTADTVGARCDIVRRLVHEGPLEEDWAELFTKMLTAVVDLPRGATAGGPHWMPGDTPWLCLFLASVSAARSAMASRAAAERRERSRTFVSVVAWA